MSKDKEYEYKINGEIVDELVYKVYKYYGRKNRYYEKDIKFERIEVDQEKRKVAFIPSKEDSYDRLLEKGRQFRDSYELSVEDKVEQSLLILEIHKILDNLSDTDRHVIYDYYYKGMNDEQISQLLGVSQSAVNQRRNRILRDLRKFFEKF